MSELLAQFVDSDFVDTLVSFAPLVGAGVLLGIAVALFGWLWGFVIRLGKLEM